LLFIVEPRLNKFHDNNAAVPLPASCQDLNKRSPRVSRVQIHPAQYTHPRADAMLAQHAAVNSFLFSRGMAGCCWPEASLRWAKQNRDGCRASNLVEKVLNPLKMNSAMVLRGESQPLGRLKLLRIHSRRYTHGFIRNEKTQVQERQPVSLIYSTWKLGTREWS
jgi:hypothetical protein